MRGFRKATITDVAQRAGVSISTVSMFVSGRESVCSPKTAERIRAAIGDLQYTPGLLVSSVQRRPTATIGVCLFSPLDAQLDYGSVFFERLWRGIVARADEEDYALLHYPLSFRQSTSTGRFLDGRIDGVLFHAHSYVSGDDRPLRLVAAGMPTVLLTQSRNVPDGCGAVYADERCTVDLAMTHLWELGHRRIAHVAGPVDGASGVEQLTDICDIAVGRLEAYRAWMRSRRVYEEAFEGQARGWCGESMTGIVDAWMRLPRPPTAVFCANDALALSVITAAEERGLRVPRDLSVIGVDNSEAAAGLTSVEPPDFDVGREAVSALLRRMRGAPLEECHVAVPVTQLFVRRTTAAVASGFAEGQKYTK